MMGVKTTSDSWLSPARRLELQGFVDELLAANDLDPSKTHKVYGEYSAEHNPAIIPLKVL